MLLACLSIVAIVGLVELEDRSSRAGTRVQPTLAHAADTSREALQSDGDRLDELGRKKIAEIMAMTRHSDMCPEPPNDWSTAFLVLMTLGTPTENQVADQERKTLALRRKIGEERWCQLYLVEVKEAYLAYQLATRQQ